MPMRHQWKLAVLVLLSGCMLAARDPPAPRIDCAFPGGNIIVDQIKGDTVSLRQDLRDTQGQWFYWYFRVRGAAGRTLDFQFTNGNVIGVRGPAISLDLGKTWRWLGADAVKDSTFRFTFPRGADEVRFCMTVPYVERNLREFLRRYGRNPYLKRDVLCRTKKGRSVELLHLGRLDGQCDQRVVIAARHHACETMASYSLEGVLAAILADSDDGKWFRQHVEFLVVPFMDKDGVEDGDQGKNRKPRDHNRDYEGESIHPSVRALRELVPRWSGGRLRFALDMHCPLIRATGWEAARDERAEDIQFVGVRNQEVWAQVERFCRIIESVQTGPLVYNTKNNTPYGTSWNKPAPGAPANTGLKPFSRWASEQPGILAATTVEIPYANAGGVAVTAESGRALGADLARALRRYLQETKNF